MLIPCTACALLFPSVEAYLALALDKTIYYELQFAIDGQALSAQVDTASSDIWVRTGPAELAVGDFEISYADGTSARGIMGLETVWLDGVAVSAVPVAAVGEGDASTNNVFGIGPKYGESCVHWRYVQGTLVPDLDAGCVPYDNLPVLLTKAGITDSALYSIRLQDEGGYLTFGAVDASCEFLNMLPMEKAVYKLYADGTAVRYSEYTGPLVLLNKISVEQRVVYAGAYPVMLDVGSTVSTFPSAIMQELRGETLSLDLRGYQMHIAMDQLRPVANDDEHMIVLGQDALQGYQIVFDYQEMQIGIGKCDTHEAPLPVQVSGGRVPFAQRAPLFDKQFRLVDAKESSVYQLWTWQAWI